MDKEIEDVIGRVRKKYGQDSVNPEACEVGIWPCGNYAIGHAIGVGGIPKGRIVELFGFESSGKSSLALCFIGAVQEAGGVCAYVDAENAYTPKYARRLGVNHDELLISQPNTGEEALGIIEMMAGSGKIALIVVDSVAALVPEAELKGEIGDTRVGTQSRMMSSALRRLNQVVADSETTVVFINQVRMKIGVMFGNPETTPGGNALKFYASLRVKVRRTSWEKDVSKNIIGIHTAVQIVKNKVAPPFGEANIYVDMRTGLDEMSGVWEPLKSAGLIRKKNNEDSYVMAKDFAGIKKVTDVTSEMAVELLEKIEASGEEFTDRLETEDENE